MIDRPRAMAFVIPHPYVDAVACFREPIKYLAASGWHVDLYTALSPAHPVPFFGTERVRLIPIAITRTGAVDLVRRLASRRPKYRWVVSVPQWGLYYSSMGARAAGIPTACISDEIKVESEAATADERRWKARERRAHQRCLWTIALSEERAAFIRQENRLGTRHPIFVVPNAAAGSARRLQSRYFQDVLALPADQRVLLHAGSLWWKGAQALVGAARSWTTDWTVVIQNRLAGSANGWHDSACLRLAPQVLPAGLMDYAVSSATIGLALYDDSCANNRLMGTASGKVALYMKNSLPVIATRVGGLNWVEREQCGACISGVDEIPAAADRIWADYERISGNVRRLFDGSLEFASRFRPVADAMDAV